MISKFSDCDITYNIIKQCQQMYSQLIVIRKYAFFHVKLAVSCE